MPLISGKNKVLIMATILLVGSFLFSVNAKKVNAWGDYLKASNGTLTASDWNNLPNDFLNKTGPAVITGPLGINTTTPPGAGLTVIGPIVATSFSGTLNARNISSGIFGADAGNGNFFFNGSVGVSTTSSAYALNVGGDINMSGILRVNGVPFSSSQWLTNGNSLYYTAGNVGVGTTNPQQKFSIGDAYAQTATLAIHDASNTPSIVLQRESTTAGKDWKIENTAGIFTLSYGYGTTYPDAWSAPAFALDHGNLGIGTTNPAARLDVVGSFQSLTGTFTGLGGDGNVVVMADNIGGLYSTSSASFISGNSLDLWKGTKNGNIWNGNAGVGNVGIGTNNPSAKLDITSNTTNALVNINQQHGWSGSEWALYVNGYSYLSGFRINGDDGIRSLFAVSNRQLGFATEEAPITFTTQTVNERMRILAGGNVGIGTTNPTSKLQVPTGVISGLGGTFTGLGSAGNVVVMADNTGGLYSTSSASFISGNSLDLWKGTKNGNIWNGDAGVGNVGIGTTNPAALLSLGTAALNNVVKLAVYDGGVATDMYGLGVSGGSLDFYAQGPSANGPKMVLKSGNLGIGTTSPTAKLDVNVTTSIRGLNVITNTDPLTDFAVINPNVASNQVALKVYTPTAGNGDVNTGLFIKSRHTGANPLYIEDVNNVGIFTVKAGGNVGIGTTNPTSKLQVPTGVISGLGGTFTGLGSAGNVVVMADNTGGLYSTSSASFISGNSLDLWKGTKNGNIWNGDAGVGNVGIGTTNPTTKFQINNNPAYGIGSLTATSNSAATNWNTNAQFLISAASGSNGIAIGASGTANDRISFIQSGHPDTQYAGSLGTLALNPLGGNVGIGTTTPTTGKLVVVGDIDLPITNAWRYIKNSATSGGLRLGTGNGAGVYTDGIEISSAGSYVKLNHNTTVTGNFYASGNVGIGTTGPNAKLHILNGTINTNNYPPTEVLITGASSPLISEIANLSIQSNSDVGIDLGGSLNLGGRSAAASAVALGYANISGRKENATSAHYGGYLQLGTSDGGGDIWERMRITSTGNVGIGTTNPTSKLQVPTGVISGLGGTFTGLGSAGNVVVMADNTGGLYSTSTASFISANSLDLWKGTKNGNIYNGDAGVGNVGIGTTVPYTKLEIAGALKFGDTTDACDANHAGAVKFNSTSGQSYLCDGTRWLNQKNCGLMTDDAGRAYGTVQIGGQCWMAENINIGTMLAAGTTEPVTTDNIIEKWCYNNDANNCTLYGGLYNWNEAMRGSLVGGAQGICASGWHIPTDDEYNKLEKTILGIIASPNSQYACDLTVSGWQRCADNSGTDAGGTYGTGKSLKSVGVGSGVGTGNDLVGFTGKLGGVRYTDGSFYYLGSNLLLWSSTPSGSNAWGRYLYSTYSTVYRAAYSKAFGFSVRCLRD